MTVYQRCPFCNQRFEIGHSDYRPMEHHIMLAHSNRPDGRKISPI